MYTRDLTCTAVVPGSVILQCTAVRSSVVKCRGYRDFGRQIATDGRSLVHAEGPKAGGDRVHGADGRKARLQRCRISNQDAAAAEVRCVFSLHLLSRTIPAPHRRTSCVCTTCRDSSFLWTSTAPTTCSCMLPCISILLHFCVRGANLAEFSSPDVVRPPHQ